MFHSHDYPMNERINFNYSRSFNNSTKKLLNTSAILCIVYMIIYKMTKRTTFSKSLLRLLNTHTGLLVDASRNRGGGGEKPVFLKHTHTHTHTRTHARFLHAYMPVANKMTPKEYGFLELSVSSVFLCAFLTGGI